jgi:hypothetical protein
MSWFTHPHKIPSQYGHYNLADNRGHTIGIYNFGNGWEIGSAPSVPLVSLQEAHAWARELVASLEYIAEREGISLD